MDHVGFMGMPQRRVTSDRLLGVGLVAAGCILSVFGTMSSSAPADSPALVEPIDTASTASVALTNGDAHQQRGMLALLSSVTMSFVAGGLPAVQACVNRQVSSRLPIKGEHCCCRRRRVCRRYCWLCVAVGRQNRKQTSCCGQLLAPCAIIAG
jgi:hypothetical protein